MNHMITATKTNRHQNNTSFVIGKTDMQRLIDIANVVSEKFEGVVLVHIIAHVNQSVGVVVDGSDATTIIAAI